MYLNYLEPSDARKCIKGQMDDELFENFRKAEITRITSMSGFMGFEFEDHQDAMEFHEHVVKSLDETMFDGNAVELKQHGSRLSVYIPLGYLMIMAIAIKQ